LHPAREKKFVEKTGKRGLENKIKNYFQKSLPDKKQ
jgi:hypothetical protein